MIAVLGSSAESSFGYLKAGRPWFVSPSPSTPCLSLINTPTLCLLLVDVDPLPLPRQE